MEDENRYQRFMTRMSEEFVVEGYRLVKKEDKHLKPSEYRDEKSQQAVEQNGNTGIHYLYDADNWRLVFGSDYQPKLVNGGFAVILANITHRRFNVYCEHIFLASVTRFKDAIEACCEYLETGEVRRGDQDENSDRNTNTKAGESSQVIR